jgi:hypothetical protein
MAGGAGSRNTGSNQSNSNYQSNVDGFIAVTML